MECQVYPLKLKRCPKKLKLGSSNENFFWKSFVSCVRNYRFCSCCRVKSSLTRRSVWFVFAEETDDLRTLLAICISADGEHHSVMSRMPILGVFPLQTFVTYSSTSVGDYLFSLHPWGCCFSISSSPCFVWEARQNLPASWDFVVTDDNLNDKFHFNDPSETCSLMNTVISSSKSYGLQLMHAFSPDPEKVCCGP